MTSLKGSANSVSSPPSGPQSIRLFLCRFLRLLSSCWCSWILHYISWFGLLKLSTYSTITWPPIMLIIAHVSVSLLISATMGFSISLFVVLIPRIEEMSDRSWKSRQLQRSIPSPLVRESVCVQVFFGVVASESGTFHISYWLRLSSNRGQMLPK